MRYSKQENAAQSIVEFTKFIMTNANGVITYSSKRKVRGNQIWKPSLNRRPWWQSDGDVSEFISDGSHGDSIGTIDALWD